MALFYLENVEVSAEDAYIGHEEELAEEIENLLIFGGFNRVDASVEASWYSPAFIVNIDCLHNDFETEDADIALREHVEDLFSSAGLRIENDFEILAWTTE